MGEATVWEGRATVRAWMLRLPRERPEDQLPDPEEGRETSRASPLRASVSLSGE